MCEECRQHPEWRRLDAFLRPFRRAVHPPRRVVERLRRIPTERRRPPTPRWKPVLWGIFLILWVLLQQGFLTPRRDRAPWVAKLPRSTQHPGRPRHEQPPSLPGLSRLNPLPIPSDR